MADAIVRGQALRWVSDDQPGWVEVNLVDADGDEHRIIEKAPVLTTVAFTSASPFPAELWIKVDTGLVVGGRVHIMFAAAVETTDGLRDMHMSVDDVVWL